MPNKFQKSVQERQNAQAAQNADAAVREEERKAAFQKSVQERQSAQAARNANATVQEEERKAAVLPPEPESIKSVQERQNVQVAQNVDAAVRVEERKVASPPEPGRLAEKVTAPSVANIGEYLSPSPARFAKNKTFYLDEDVISALKAAAQSQRVTDSKLVNDIIRTVLLGKK